MQNWDRLRVFATVAQAGSVGAAAQELGVTPPAVTQQIRKLERDLRTELVVPRGRGITLTAAGQRVADYAHDMRDGIRALARDLDALAGTVGGPLEIGAPMSVNRSLLLPALRRLVDHHPAVAPHIYDGEAADFIAHLGTYALDAAIVERWPVDGLALGKNYRSVVLRSEPVRIVVPMEFARDRDVSSGGLRGALAALHRKPWVVCPPGSGSLNTLRWLGRSHGLHVNVAHLISSLESQLEVVAAGLACALLPESALQGAAQHAPGDALSVLDVDTGITRQVEAVVRVDDDRPVIDALLEELTRPGT